MVAAALPHSLNALAAQLGRWATTHAVSPSRAMFVSILPVVARRRALEQQILDPLRAAGALAPASAHPLSGLSAEQRAVLDELVEHGRVREAQPGAYYIFQRARRGRAHRALILKTVLFWLLVLLLPIALVQLTAW